MARQLVRLILYGSIFSLLFLSIVEPVTLLPISNSLAVLARQGCSSLEVLQGVLAEQAAVLASCS